MPITSKHPIDHPDQWLADTSRTTISLATKNEWPDKPAMKSHPSRLPQLLRAPNHVIEALLAVDALDLVFLSLVSAHDLDACGVGHGANRRSRGLHGIRRSRNLHRRLFRD